MIAPENANPDRKATLQVFDNHGTNNMKPPYPIALNAPIMAQTTRNQLWF